MRCTEPNPHDLVTGSCPNTARWIVQAAYLGYPNNEIIYGPAKTLCGMHLIGLMAAGVGDLSLTFAGYRAARIEHWEKMAEVKTLRGHA